MRPSVRWREAVVRWYEAVVRGARVAREVRVRGLAAERGRTATALTVTTTAAAAAAASAAFTAAAAASAAFTAAALVTATAAVAAAIVAAVAATREGQEGAVAAAGVERGCAPKSWTLCDQFFAFVRMLVCVEGVHRVPCTPLPIYMCVGLRIV